MAFTKKNEEAVSPVIGVILMVAITVILAAVIAAFVFGMAGNISKTKIVAATTSKVPTSTSGVTAISVTYQGGQDAASVVRLMYDINGQVSSDDNPQVGWTRTAAGTTGKDHVIVSARFNDDSSQVILDTYV